MNKLPPNQRPNWKKIYDTLNTPNKVVLDALAPYLKKSKAKSTTSENAEQNSFIDEETGIVYLRSSDFHKRSGEEWIVDDKSISVRLNRNKRVTTTPFSKIQQVKLEAHRLTFYLLGMQTHDPSGDGSWGTEERVALIKGANIYFNEVDFHIAQEIHSRITQTDHASTSETTSKSVVDELKELKQMLYSRLITQEEYDTLKAKSILK